MSECFVVGDIWLDREGNEVKIIKNDPKGEGDWPILGIIPLKDSVRSYTAKGNYYADCNDSRDLMRKRSFQGMQIYKPFFKKVEGPWDSDKIFTVGNFKIVEVEPMMDSLFYSTKVVDLVFKTVDGITYTKMMGLILKSCFLSREYLTDMGFKNV